MTEPFRGAASPVPTLPPGCNSWTIVRKGTRAAVCELFDARTVAKLNTAKYDAIPTRTYLEDLNRALKAAR